MLICRFNLEKQAMINRNEYQSLNFQAGVVTERKRIAQYCRNGTDVSDEVVESLIKNDYASVELTPQNAVRS